MAANIQTIIYSGLGGKNEYAAACDAMPSATAIFLPTSPIELWNDANGRLGLNDMIASKGKQVWLAGIRGDWGTAKIAALIDYWENKSGVANLIAGYCVRDEWPISEQQNVGDDIALLHSLTGKPIWANINPPSSASAMAQYFNFGTDIKRYPNIFSGVLYPREASDTFSYSTYTKTIADTAAMLAMMLDAYKNAPVYLSPANGHVVGLISQAFQQTCVNRDDRATMNTGYCVVDQALIDAQMRLMFGQGEYAYLSGASYQRDGKQILQGNATWYTWWDAGQDNGTRTNLSGGVNTTARDNMRSWVNTANANAKSNFAIVGGVVFPPNAGGSPPSGQVATPAITPATGTFNSGQTVTITCATSGAAIYYTTDGSTPTTSSAAYSAPFSVYATTTIKAIAAKSGMTTSAVATSAITIAPAQPGNVTQIKFYPFPGLESRLNGGVFAVSNDYVNWTTIYTIPTTPAAGWNTVSVTTTTAYRYIRFQSSASQYAAMAEIEYYNGANKLTGGVIASSFADGNPPSAAFDGKTGAAWKSAELAGWVVLDLNAPINVIPALDPLEATAAPGGEVKVMVRNAERATIKQFAGVPGFAEIGYAGSDWFNVNIKEAGQGTLQVVLSDGTTLTLSVRGTAATNTIDWRSIVKSPQPVRGYVAPPVTPTQVELPTILPVSGLYSTAQTITIACATSGATVRYTTDGTEPSATSTIYTTALTVSVSATVKAKAFKAGMTDSATAMAVYTIAASPSPITQTIGSGANAIVLTLAQDYYLGNAHYVVRVDGTQVGGELVAGALKSSGTVDTLTLKGNWGSGDHTVEVQFLNDAYGGTQQTDRNLYVLSATYDGAPLTPSSASLLSAGTATFKRITSTLRISLWVYDVHLGEVLSDTVNKVADLGFNAIITDAHPSNVAQDKATLAKFIAKGIGVYFLLTRGGPTIDALTQTQIDAFAAWTTAIKNENGLLGYFISDEADNVGGTRTTKYASLVAAVNGADSVHPTVMVSNGNWSSDPSIPSSWRTDARTYLTAGDDTYLFSPGADAVKVASMMTELATLFAGGLGIFIASWWVPNDSRFPMATAQQISTAALASKINSRARELAAWSWRHYDDTLAVRCVGNDATLYARVKEAIASIRAQW